MALLVHASAGTQPFNKKATGTAVWPFLYRCVSFLNSLIASLSSFVSVISCLSLSLSPSPIFSPFPFSLLALGFVSD